MKTIIQKLTTIIGVCLALVPSAHAASLILNGANSSRPSGTPDTLFDGSGSVFHQVADTLIYVIGAVAVIMLIVGGVRYVISQGNEKNVVAAKDTILYAVIGIVVAIAAYAIVNFVASSIK